MTTTAMRPRRAPASAPPVMRRASDSPARKTGTDQLIRGLGWFSIALGVAEIVAPDKVANLVGLRNSKDPTTIRLFGLREMASGIGILTSSEPEPWLWARVAGDAMDLALLGMPGKNGADQDRRIVSALAVAGVTALDIYSSQKRHRTDGLQSVSAPRQIEVRKTITVARPPSDVYAFWRNLENLPRFMEHLESVRVLDDLRSSWKAKGPAGSEYEWQAEITEDRPGELIAWRSLPHVRCVQRRRRAVRASPSRPGHRNSRRASL